MFLLLSLVLHFMQPAVIIEPASSHTFIPETGVLFKLDQSTHSWHDLSSGLPDGINPISFWSENGQFFLGASEGLFTTSGVSPIQAWKKALILQKDILGIFPGKAGPYAIALWNGFFQYDPALDLWRPMSEKLNEKSVYCITESPNGKLYTGGETGIYSSSDHGKSWQHIFSKGHVTNFVWVDDVLIACHGQSLWRSSDEGESWERVFHQTSRAAQIKKTPIGLVAIFDGQEYAGIRTPNGIYLSTDNGMTWRSYSIGISAGLNDIYDLEIIDNTFYAVAQGGIFYSSDKGHSWNALISRPESGNFFKMIVSEGILYALLIKGC